MRQAIKKIKPPRPNIRKTQKVTLNKCQQIVTVVHHPNQKQRYSRHLGPKCMAKGQFLSHLSGASYKLPQLPHIFFLFLKSSVIYVTQTHDVTVLRQFLYVKKTPHCLNRAPNAVYLLLTIFRKMRRANIISCKLPVKSGLGPSPVPKSPEVKPKRSYPLFSLVQGPGVSKQGSNCSCERHRKLVQH